MGKASVSNQEVSAIIEFIGILSDKLNDIQDDLNQLKKDTKQIKDDIRVIGGHLGLERSERGNLWKPTF